MGLSNFEVRADPFKRGEDCIVVDGVPLGGFVRRVTVDWDTRENGGIPRVYLEASQPGVIEGAGVVLERETVDVTRAVLEFLRGVDATALEADALELLGKHENIESVGEAILAQLQVYAQAEADGD